ncbi:P-loop containing nucleoside triphosphate hydrolase protein [Xylaria flabelliformis]|nr:P-loop containing nucleoside triphosphate hydrolase protein [Xylaria flabelliformis]KAI0859824.1 P-loop containing nucleoside triphosphate hydrolase protein [Xylaria cubensis]
MRREIDTVPTPAHVKPKKLVVLSAPRSGTRGLYLALKQLGFAPYHMAEVIGAGTPALKILLEGTNAEWLHEGTPYGRAEFDKWFANYDVIVEMPFFMLRSTLKTYPDAKFLLTERDPEKWAKSFMNTIGWAALRLRRLPMSILKNFDSFAFYMDLFGGQMVDYYTNGFGASDEGRKALVENYKLYIAEVKRLVPPEQLKVVKLEDGFGWNELCPYLGVPIPDTPWPALNKTEEFQGVVGSKMKKAISKGMAGVASVVVFAAVAMWYGRRNLLPLLT